MNTATPSQGELLGELGSRRALNHANRQAPKWGDKALQFLIRCPLQTFSSEDVRKYAHKRGLPQPPDPRAWGAVIRKAVSTGLIQFYEINKSSNPQAHHRPIQVWQKIEQIPENERVA